MSENVKPLFLITPDTISAADIERAEKECGIVIVACSSPETARFLEPPATATVSDQARAALSLMRVIINGEKLESYWTQGTLVRWFVRQLIDGKPIEPVRKVGKK